MKKGKLYKSNSEIVLCTGDGKYGNTFSGVVVSVIDSHDVEGVYDNHTEKSNYSIGYYSNLWSQKFFLEYNGMLCIFSSSESKSIDTYDLDMNNYFNNPNIKFLDPLISNFKNGTKSYSIAEAMDKIDGVKKSASKNDELGLFQVPQFITDFKNVEKYGHE